MPAISILIKPASSSCNMSCKYCFYHDVSSNRSVRNYGIMGFDTLEAIVSKAFDNNRSQVSFAFQGGEPTLAGLDFFERFIVLVKKYNTKNITVKKAIQTNGYIIDENWTRFFKENEFLVGVSLDGPKDIHDANRLDSRGEGTFNKVIKAIGLLKKEDVPFNILCVLTSMSAKHILKEYNFFKKQGFRYLQFIPCLDSLEERGAERYTLKPDEYLYVLNMLFEQYKHDYFNNNYVSIRNFDNYIRMAMGYQPESCDMAGICSCYYVIEANGDVYPCDFYALDEYKIGNISNDSFDEMKTSNSSISFINESKKFNDDCIECKYSAICRNGCKRYRDIETGKNKFCSAYFNFFDKNLKDINEMAMSMKYRYL